jgi:hypothetical protein
MTKSAKKVTVDRTKLIVFLERFDDHMDCDFCPWRRECPYRCTGQTWFCKKYVRGLLGVEEGAR